MSVKPHLRRPQDACRYDTDIVAWAQEQARLLRSGRWERPDIGHLAEEIKDRG